jgi:hypothetical protein
MKKLRYAFILMVGLVFYSMLLAVSIRHIYLSNDEGQRRLGFLSKPLVFLAETPKLISQALQPPEFMVANSEFKDGFTYFDGHKSEVNSKLLVSYKTEKYGSKFDLLDINTGTVIKQWTPENETLYEQAYNPLNPRKPPFEGSDLYLMHPLMMNDSSLLFTAQLTSLMAKIDKNSKLLWMKNDRTYHHSLEKDADGNIYACTQPFESDRYDFLPGNYEDYKTKLLDDHITMIDPDTGAELFDKAVIKILVENGYKDLLLHKGQVISDPIHLNDVQPALYSTEYWQKGDLLVSCRNISAVFLYRPTTNKIIWLQHGPWYNQHDADFYGDDKIVVFGNDVIRDESTTDPRMTTEDLSFTGERSHNEVYVHDFSKDTTITPYHRLMKEENVKTITSGRCDILPNGDIFVEETTQGKIIVGDSISKKIVYVKRVDDENVSWLFWSRIIN